MCLLTQVRVLTTLTFLHSAVILKVHKQETHNQSSYKVNHRMNSCGKFTILCWPHDNCPGPYVVHRLCGLDTHASACRLLPRLLFPWLFLVLTLCPAEQAPQSLKPLPASLPSLLQQSTEQGPGNHSGKRIFFTLSETWSCADRASLKH